MNKKRVVITGIGVIAANGVGVDNFWEACIHGVSGVSWIEHFDASQLNSKIAAVVKNFNPADYIPINVVRKTDRFVHLGLAAALMAVGDAQISLDLIDRERAGVIIGSGLGGMMFHEEQILQGYEKGVHRLNPMCVPKITPNAISGQIAIHLKMYGPNITISTACSSGTHAIGQAFRMIQNDEIDMAISGGAEAPLTEFNFGAYDAMQVLSSRNDIPQKASRPFDKNRDGFVMGEGSGILILEELGHALKRNAKIYAEIAGYASTCGAYHMVIPRDDGLDAARAMHLALKDAGMKPNQVHYINAHGTSTSHNDRVETKAIKHIFGSYCDKVPISSTKSMIGHTLGAAGAIEMAICALTIKKNIVHPTINHEELDPECDLDYIPNIARAKVVDCTISNSFGFGSSNACIATRRFYD